MAEFSKTRQLTPKRKNLSSILTNSHVIHVEIHPLFHFTKLQQAKIKLEIITNGHAQSLFFLVAQMQPLLSGAYPRLLYKLSHPGSAYVQIHPLITPKNVFMQNMCRDFNK